MLRLYSCLTHLYYFFLVHHLEEVKTKSQVMREESNLSSLSRIEVQYDLSLLKSSVIPSFLVWHFVGNDKYGGSNQVAVVQVRIPL